VNAFQVKSWGKFILWLLLGVLYVVAGFAAFENPLLAAAVLTLVLGVALVVSGFMRIILAFGMKEGMPWMWIVLSGVITVLLGGIILAHCPSPACMSLDFSSASTSYLPGLAGSRSAWDFDGAARHDRLRVRRQRC